MAGCGIERTLARGAVALAATAAPFAHAAAGDEQELALAFGDSAVVSIATGAPQPLRRAPAVASVITADEIRAMGATDLDDVLERVPGLHVSRTSLLYNPLITVRGIFTQYNGQLLMLFNGQPLTTMLRGDRGTKGFRGWPVENIARIEVIRGPGSALYGADAYAGVINIITKSARDLPGQGEAGTRASSFGGRDGWAQAALRFGELELAGFVRVGRDDGFAATVEIDAQTANDAAFGSRASRAPGTLSVGRELIDTGLDAAWERWRLRANYSWRDMGSGIGVSQSLDPNGRETTRRLLADLGWTEAQLSAEWGAGANVSLQTYKQLIPIALEIFPPGVTFPTGTFPQGMLGAPETWERQLRASAWLSFGGWRGHQWRFGVGHDDIDMVRTAEKKNFSFAPNGLPIPLPAFTDHSDLDPFLRPHRRRVDYAYLQDTWTVAPDWQLTAGLRHDRFSDVGGTTNPRLALVWEAAHDLTVKLLHGRAFRAPAFSELYSITNPVARGNPALAPETIRNSEAVVLWQPRRDLDVHLSVFRYALGALIRAIPNAIPGTGTTFANIGEQRGRGFELEVRWEPRADLRLQASWSQARAVDRATGVDAGYAPHRHAYLLAEWRPAAQWLASAQLNRVAGRARAAGDARAPVADYTGLDLALRWAAAERGWGVSAGVRNALDADQREPSFAPGRIARDLPLPPRSVYAEATWRF